MPSVVRVKQMVLKALLVCSVLARSISAFCFVTPIFTASKFSRLSNLVSASISKNENVVDIISCPRRSRKCCAFCMSHPATPGGDYPDENAKQNEPEVLFASS
jgi:hypothetical protein